MARKKRTRNRYYVAKCRGCGHRTPIAHLGHELCANCTNYMYRMAYKIIQKGGKALQEYRKQYVDKPQHRYRMLVDTGVVHDQADAKCVRDGSRSKKYRRPYKMTA